MKSKFLMSLLALAVFVHCQKEQIEPKQSIPAPVLFEPADGTTDYFQNVTYRWEETPNADLYQIQVSDTESFASLKDEGSVNSTHFVSRKLLSENTAYYWRVRARVSDEWREWSDTARFEVGWRHNVPDFRKRYEGTYILRNSVHSYQCVVFNPPGMGPPCAEYGYFNYVNDNDTLVVKFDDLQSLRVGGPNLQDTTGYIYLNSQDGAIHSDGKFSGSFSWPCTSRSISGYFRNDSLMYTLSTGTGGCDPSYTTHFYSGKRQ